MNQTKQIIGQALVSEEIAGLLSQLSEAQMRCALDLLRVVDGRWFCSGQGRSGLVAQMIAMRLMHLGFVAHAVGEATAPSIGPGDGLVMISGSGETPATLHLAGIAKAAGARILAVTRNATSSLAAMAEVVLEIPVGETRQFGGSLFEQGALLTFDALVWDLTSAVPDAHEAMALRHTNLQ